MPNFISRGYYSSATASAIVRLVCLRDARQTEALMMFDDVWSKRHLNHTVRVWIKLWISYSNSKPFGEPQFIPLQWMNWLVEYSEFPSTASSRVHHPAIFFPRNIVPFEFFGPTNSWPLWSSFIVSIVFGAFVHTRKGSIRVKAYLECSGSECLSIYCPVFRIFTRELFCWRCSQ